ncbi:uncharacterized protein LOC123415193 isoform X2 [Hordeum vulgare subsp. vulgare]|uniref:uncharacterized protein LOC123415193 isoform X2 n=1 Tax=Hordeum vulgare subsp. vulgare TaxID=112509 RepID=UPI001D1A4A07|nr:uncharacterized protein LOC123415193 isoform X2 [Hordeum vulgare subsp. vulgare]
MLPSIKFLIENKLPVWIFRYSIQDLGLPVTTPWRPWVAKGEVAGYVQQYAGGLTFLSVRGAGHLVPSLQPERALKPTMTHQTTWTSFCKYVDEEIFVMDLKKGFVSTGNYEGTPDASFTFTDDDFLPITSGKLNLHMAFIRGKLKIKGSINTAQKFTPDIFPKPSKL